MSRLPRTTIEQWAVLRAIVESGGFAQAARYLHRGQSSISYAVTQLQERLGVELLHISGRKAQLTAAGHYFLAELIPLVDELSALEDQAQAVAQQLQHSVRLLVEAIFPKDLLFRALRRFEKEYPTIEIQLHEIVRRRLVEMPPHSYDIAIAHWDSLSMDTKRLLDIEMVAVAHPFHPLSQFKGSIGKTALSRHRVVVIQDDDGISAGLNVSGASRKQWKMNTVEGAVTAAESGLCYGWLPRHVIGNSLVEGRLVALPLSTGASRIIPLTMHLAQPESPGPATVALAALIADLCKDQLRRAV